MSILAPARAPRRQRRRGRVATLTAITLALFTACGADGGSGGDAPAPMPVAALAGSVAVGAPITGGSVRVLDASGAEIASNVGVADDGSYRIPTLNGNAPYRIEACGYVGPLYQCIQSVAQGPGVAHVTPLTSAALLLATGQSPAALMNGAANGVGAAAIEGAQQQLRTSLAGVMNGHVEANFDFIGGTLAAGARTGYDRVLDSLGVATGSDGQPFVQITPRLGEGNLFLQQGTSQGALQVDRHASSLSLGGLEELFRGMTAAIAGPAACNAAGTGLATFIAPNARLHMGPAPMVGAAQVAAGLCQFMAMEGRWGSRFVSPALGRCDLNGAAPVCRVSFALQDPAGDVEAVGERMAVMRVGDAWKFMGDMDALPVRVNATVQRDRRLDAAPWIDRYTRALSFDIPAAAGLACAKVSQRNADGQPVTVAYFKRHAGALGQERLSLWTQGALSNAPSLDPLAGHTRSADDTWLHLPEGAEGDAVIRNFLRGGRSVTLALYADAACSNAFNLEGRQSIEVDIEGVPPVWSAMAALPWPGISSPTFTALDLLTLQPGASAEYIVYINQAESGFGAREATVCGNRADCGEGGSARLGHARVRPAQPQVAMTLNNRGNTAVAQEGHKTVSLFGRNGEGLQMQANFNICRSQPQGQPCQ